jgi:hypothetical protein
VFRLNMTISEVFFERTSYDANERRANDWLQRCAPRKHKGSLRLRESVAAGSPSGQVNSAFPRVRRTTGLRPCALHLRSRLRLT